MKLQRSWEEKLEVLDGILHGFNYQEYFTADTSRKLNIILEAEEHILGVDQGEGKTLLPDSSHSDVTGIRMGCTTPHMRWKLHHRLLSFQAIKARLAKFSDGFGQDLRPKQC